MYSCHITWKSVNYHRQNIVNGKIYLTLIIKGGWMTCDLGTGSGLATSEGYEKKKEFNKVNN